MVDSCLISHGTNEMTFNGKLGNVCNSSTNFGLSKSKAISGKDKNDLKKKRRYKFSNCLSFHANVCEPTPECQGKEVFV